MSLHARYDLKEDRMLLTVQPHPSAPVAIWVTRRQWLNLMHALPKFAPALAGGSAAADAAPPPHSRRKRAPAGAAEPVLLSALRLAAQPAGVRLIFVIGEQAVSMDFTAEGVAQLQAMLTQQAERAGWDAVAALERLDAASLADAVMKNARKLH